LGFSFTLILGTIGYIVAITKDFNPREDYWTMVRIYIFTSIVFIILIFLHVCIVWSGYVLTHYRKSWQWIRCQIYKGDCKEIAKQIDIFRDLKQSKFFSHQKIGELLIPMFCVIILVGQILIRILYWSDFNSCTYYTTLVCLCLIAGVLFFGIYTIRRYKIEDTKNKKTKNKKTKEK